MSNIQGVTIEPQRIFIDTATRSLVFDPLNSTHEASYKCEAKLILPDFESFNTSMLYHLNVLSAYSTYMYVHVHIAQVFTSHLYACNIVYLTDRSIVQLRFGPMIHCSKWYDNKVCILLYMCVHNYNYNFFLCLSWSMISSRLWPVLLMRIVVVVSNNHTFPRGNSAVKHKTVM